jgi:hypothetical protein
MSSCAGKSQSSLLPSMRARNQHETTPAAAVEAEQIPAASEIAVFSRLMSCSCAGFYSTIPNHVPPYFHFFKDTSIRDMKSKPSTPRAPVPGISPSCSGTQSPRHPHLAASCIGQRWSPVKRAKLLCQRIHALVRLLLTWVCGDCVVRLPWSRGFLPVVWVSLGASRSLAHISEWHI